MPTGYLRHHVNSLIPFIRAIFWNSKLFRHPNMIQKSLWLRQIKSRAWWSIILSHFFHHECCRSWHVQLPSSLTKQVSKKQQENVSSPRPAPAVSIYLPNWWKYLLLKTKRIIFLLWLCSRDIWTVLRAFVWGGNRLSEKTQPAECLHSSTPEPRMTHHDTRRLCLHYFTEKSCV